VDFTPSEIGEILITYYFKDNNECDDEISKLTKVNPLPNIDLSDNPTKFESEEGLMLSPKEIEPGVIYEWSNGSFNPSIFVYAPGYYELIGTFTATGCMDKDSIFIEILENNKDLDQENIVVYTNTFKY
jgi:hypothetical protein